MATKRSTKKPAAKKHAVKRSRPASSPDVSAALGSLTTAVGEMRTIMGTFGMKLDRIAALLSGVEKTVELNDSVGAADSEPALHVVPDEPTQEVEASQVEAIDESTNGVSGVATPIPDPLPNVEPGL